MVATIRIFNVDDSIKETLRNSVIFKEGKVENFYTNSIASYNDGKSVIKCIMDVLKIVKNNKSLFDLINMSGGKIELYITYMLSNINGTIYLPPDIINELSKYGISLGVD